MGSDQARQKFTGTEQDNPDIGFFQARYYMPAQGRFNSWVRYSDLAPPVFCLARAGFTSIDENPPESPD